MFQERGTDGTDEPSEVDTLSTSSSMLDTSHDSSYESRKISSISVHETMQTPTHRNSFVASSTPVQLKSKLSSTISPISEERLESERSDQKPRKGPAPPPPQYSPPPQKRQRSVSDIVPNTTRVNGEVFSADHDEDEPVTPVRNIANELKNDVHHEETVESESGDTLVDDSDDDDDLSPEKERVLQMLDSVIQEQEESFTGAVSDTEETEEQRLETPEVTDHQPTPPEHDDEQICISTSSSSSSATSSSPSSPVQQSSSETTESEERVGSPVVTHLSARPTSISPGESRPETPRSSSGAPSSPVSLSTSPSPSPSMDRPSPDGSSTGGSPLPGHWKQSRSPSPKNNVEVTVIELAPPSSLESSETPAAPPSSLTMSPSTSPPAVTAPATPDRHVSVIVVGSSQQDYKVQDSSSIGSPSPQILDIDQKSSSVVESLSPPPGFESHSSVSSDHDSLSSSVSEDGRKSVSSKKSGTSLMIEGTTTEETSTDLSLDLGKVITSSVSEASDNVEKHVEEVVSEQEETPEDPIVPVLKNEAPKKSKEPKRQDSVHMNNNNLEKPRQQDSRKVSGDKREKSPRKSVDERDNLARQEEERRIAREVREGRERYDRRSQDRLDDVVNGYHKVEHVQVEQKKRPQSQSRKESSEMKTPSKREAESRQRSGEKVSSSREKPDLVQKNQSPARNNNQTKQEIYNRKTQRSTSEATGLHPNGNHFNRQESEETEVILRKKPVKPELEPATAAAVTENQPEIGSAIERKKPLTKEDIQKMNLKKKTRKRTRKFEIDGVTVTTTTSKVIYRDEESETFYDEHYFRKQELRELKMLQKQEQKQFQDLAFKNQLYREQQEKRFDSEKATLTKNYENDLSSMVDGQKKQVDKCENQQQDELKVSSKKIRNEQEKELKSFRESLKQETKLLKHEVELLPKDRRKEALKIRKEQLEREHIDRERHFVDRLNESHESHMKRLSDTHREKIALLGKF